MSKKLMIGIDVDEVLRAKWFQFDKHYIEEFGEEGTPKGNPYVFDYFEAYKFNDTVETEKELKEPEDMPADINPLDYQHDEKLGEAPADIFLFKTPVKTKLTAKKVYNRFINQDFLFEIFGAAPMMYRNMDVYVNKFLEQYQNFANFTVMSIENKFTIPPTLFFLSKISMRFKNYYFVEKAIDMWNHVDVLITTNPEILKGGAPWGKKLIKIIRPYNENIKVGSIEVKQVADLIDNKKFEKIIKYKNK
jgi:hypothetical protein